MASFLERDGMEIALAAALTSIAEAKEARQAPRTERRVRPVYFMLDAFSRSIFYERKLDLLRI